MTTIYFDESGNPEEGLTDKEQMYITFASHSFDEDLCERVINKVFSRSRAKELHFQTLNRKNRITKSIQLLTELRNTDPEAIYKVYVIYKPLFIFHSFLTLFHDQAVELFYPDVNTGDIQWMYDRYHTLWENCRLSHGEEYLLQILENYIFFVKNKSQASYDTIMETVRIGACQGNQDLQLVYNWSQHSSFEEIAPYITSQYLDTTATCIRTLLHDWTAILKVEHFSVIHDASNMLQKRQEQIHAFFGKHTSTTHIPMVEDPDKKWNIVNAFPIESFIFARSEDYYALQVADILAGVTNEFAKKAGSQRCPGLTVNNFENLARLIGDLNYRDFLPRSKLGG